MNHVKRRETAEQISRAITRLALEAGAPDEVCEHIIVTATLLRGGERNALGGNWEAVVLNEVPLHCKDAYQAAISQVMQEFDLLT